jgi:hypothetical protein
LFEIIKSPGCTCSVATRVSSNYLIEVDDEKLDTELLIVVGARVMLTSNLWTNAGLVNGALGVVEQIVYNPGISPPEPPTYILVRFDNYVGVPWDEAFPQTVPIIPIERGKERQIPLRLAWGLTIHKSHGLTLEKKLLILGRQSDKVSLLLPYLELKLWMVFDFNLHFHLIDMKRWESVQVYLREKKKKRD